MIKLIVGEKGSGKTSKMIELANKDTKSCKGNVVYVQANNKHMLDLHHDVRLINAMEFDINNIDSFRGFLCGIMAGNYDIEKIYIDKVYKITEVSFDNLDNSFNQLEKLSDEYNVDFIFGLRMDPGEVPQSYKEKVIEWQQLKCGQKAPQGAFLFAKN